MSDQYRIFGVLREALLHEDWGGVKRSAEAIDAEVFDAEGFSDDLFEGLMSLARDPLLYQAAESVLFFKLFEFNLDLLTEMQRLQFVEVVKFIVDKLRDEVAAFLVIELLIELAPNAATLDYLKGMLSSSDSEGSSGIALHGLDWLAKKTSDARLKQACLDALSKLANHSCQTIRSDAHAALLRRLK